MGVFRVNELENVRDESNSRATKEEEGKNEEDGQASRKAAVILPNFRSADGLINESRSVFVHETFVDQSIGEGAKREFNTFIKLDAFEFKDGSFFAAFIVVEYGSDVIVVDDESDEDSTSGSRKTKSSSNLTFPSRL